MKGKNNFIIYGLVTGSVMAATAISLYFAGLEHDTGMYFIVCIPLLFGILLHGFMLSKANEGYVTFRQVFERSFYAAVIAVGILVVWNVVSLVSLPDRKTQALALDYNMAGYYYKMEDKGMTDDQIANLPATQYMGMYIYLISIFKQLFQTLLFGALLAAGAATVANTHGTRVEEEWVKEPDPIPGAATPHTPDLPAADNVLL